jgi:hypothetical protein
MMASRLRISQPVRSGTFEVSAVVRETTWSAGHCGMVSAEPVAIVIGDGKDEWFFALEKRIGQDVVDKAMKEEADPGCEPETCCPIRRIFLAGVDLCSGIFRPVRDLTARR